MLGCPLKAENLEVLSPTAAAAPGEPQGLSHTRALATAVSAVAKRNPFIGRNAEPQQTGNWVPFAEPCHGGGGGQTEMLFRDL